MADIENTKRESKLLYGLLAALVAGIAMLSIPFVSEINTSSDIRNRRQFIKKGYDFFPISDVLPKHIAWSPERTVIVPKGNSTDAIEYPHGRIVRDGLYFKVNEPSAFDSKLVKLWEAPRIGDRPAYGIHFPVASDDNQRVVFQIAPKWDPNEPGSEKYKDLPYQQRALLVKDFNDSKPKVVPYTEGFNFGSISPFYLDKSGNVFVSEAGSENIVRFSLDGSEKPVVNPTYFNPDIYLNRGDLGDLSQLVQKYGGLLNLDGDFGTFNRGSFLMNKDVWGYRKSE
jgi:hypothetical protein